MAHCLSVKPHVLRYWEQEFPSLKPAKRNGNRRCYRRKDLLMALHIATLLYEKGYTIQGAKALIAGSDDPSDFSVPTQSIDKAALKDCISDLERLIAELKIDMVAMGEH